MLGKNMSTLFPSTLERWCVAQRIPGSTAVRVLALVQQQQRLSYLLYVLLLLLHLVHFYTLKTKAPGTAFGRQRQLLVLLPSAAATAVVSYCFSWHKGLRIPGPAARTSSITGTRAGTAAATIIPAAAAV